MDHSGRCRNRQPDKEKIRAKMLAHGQLAAKPFEDHSAELNRKLAALMVELNRSPFRASSANYLINMKDIDALECT